MKCPYCSKEIGDEAIICGHCGRAVMESADPSFTEVTGFDQEQVLFEARDEKRHYTWQLANVELDPVARTLAIYGFPAGIPEITIPVSEIARCEIIESVDIPRDRNRTSGGDISGGSDLGDLVLGLLFIVLFAIFEATIENFRAKRTKMPVLRLTQSRCDNLGQGWVIDLRSDKRGNEGRAATLEMAHRVVAMLCLTGYAGAIPEEVSLPEDPEAFVKETRVTQEQLVRRASIGRVLKWSSIAGAIVGLLIGWQHGSHLQSHGCDCPDFTVGPLVGLSVGAVVGTGLGAAIEWRQNRTAGMLAGAAAAAVVASITALVVRFLVTILVCYW